MRWVVIDTRVYEVSGSSEAEALALITDQPDREPVYHSTTAELLPRAQGRRPVLRIMPSMRTTAPGRGR